MANTDPLEFILNRLESAITNNDYSFSGYRQHRHDLVKGILELRKEAQDLKNENIILKALRNELLLLLKESKEQCA